MIYRFTIEWMGKSNAFCTCMCDPYFYVVTAGGFCQGEPAALVEVKIMVAPIGDLSNILLWETEKVMYGREPYINCT